MELSAALAQLLNILCTGIKNRAIVCSVEVKSQLINWFLSQPLFIKALFPIPVWEV